VAIHPIREDPRDPGSAWRLPHLLAYTASAFGSYPTRPVGIRQAGSALGPQGGLPDHCLRSATVAAHGRKRNGCFPVLRGSKPTLLASRQLAVVGAQLGSMIRRSVVRASIAGLA
jgi:hypothetical protein